MVIKRIGPLSAAKIAGTLYALFGFCIGAVISLIAMAGAALGRSNSGWFGALLGVGAVILFPIIYGSLSFVFTLMGAVVYNVVAGMVGGIEIETQ